MRFDFFKFLFLIWSGYREYVSEFEHIWKVWLKYFQCVFYWLFYYVFDLLTTLFELDEFGQNEPQLQSKVPRKFLYRNAEACYRHVINNILFILSLTFPIVTRHAWTLNTHTHKKQKKVLVLLLVSSVSLLTVTIDFQDHYVGCWC